MVNGIFNFMTWLGGEEFKFLLLISGGKCRRENGERERRLDKRYFLASETT